jgi:hypothetical protein
MLHAEGNGMRGLLEYVDGLRKVQGGHESAIPESRLELMPSLQPNPQTQAHQLNLWSALVLSWARHQRIWTVNTDAKEGDLGEVFWNKGIRRE